MSAPRIAPLDPPYDPDIAESLAKWMPPGSKIEPLKLFRTLVRSPEISSRLRALGAGILGSRSLIAPVFGHIATNSFAYVGALVALHF